MAEDRFPKLSQEQIEWVCRLGEVLHLDDGKEILAEGREGYDFYVVVEGRVQITKQVAGGVSVLRIHEPREFIGELSLLTGGPSPITARSQGAARVVRLSPSALRDVLSRCPEMAELVIPAMAKRVHDVEGMLQERERLASLGKLAAGLAHELNNPVAAGSRAVAGVRGLLTNLRNNALKLGETCFSPSEMDRVRGELELATEALRNEPDLDPLERSDREEELADFLTARGCSRAWDNAPVLVSAGFDAARLQELVGRFDEDAAHRALEFIATQLAVEMLLRDAERSLFRITDIVRAVKSYSRMDQAPIEEAKLTDGIEDTLKMLAYPLRPFKVVRDYDPEVPTVCAYASELNQVWTNLIDNAIAAMGPGGGTLTVRTRLQEPDGVRVEIADTGPGIPAEIQDRVFDAFFTTKPAGEGTGLGLDISQRIIEVKHNGQIGFDSSSEGTRFWVWLPIRQPEA